MKTRNGFVSNSSSSSFVIITPKSAVDEVYPTLTPFEKEVVGFMSLWDRKYISPFMGTDVVIYSGGDGDNDTLGDFKNSGDTEEEEENYKYNGDSGVQAAWSKYQNLLKEASKGNYIRVSTDC